MSSEKGSGEMQRMFSSWQIDDAIFSIKMKIWKKTSSKESESLIAPLEWWINTGRASTPFLKALVFTTERQKLTIANKLVQGGSYEEAIKRVRDYLGE